MVAMPNRSKQQLMSKIRYMKLRVTKERKSAAQAKTSTRCRSDLCNVNASEIIRMDSKEACYVLGLLWADGYLLNNKWGKYRIVVEMMEEDLSTVVDFFDKFGRWNRSYRQRAGRKPTLSLTTSNKELFSFLEVHGYTNKRTGSTDILKFIKDDLKPYWLRGLFDGDGCCYVNKSLGLYQVSIAGSYEQDWSFLQQPLQTINNLNVVRRVQSAKSSSSTVRFQGKRNIRLFREFLYPNEIFDFGLRRKFDKLMSV
jgi:hypothetical protein